MVVLAGMIELHTFFPPRYASGFLLSHLVKSCSERFLTEDAAVEVDLYYLLFCDSRFSPQVEKFFTEHPLPGSERNVAQSVETIRLHAAWLSRDATDISNFFKKY